MGMLPFLSEDGEVERLTAFGCSVKGKAKTETMLHSHKQLSIQTQMYVGYDTPTALPCSTAPNPTRNPAGLISPTASQANNNM